MNLDQMQMDHKLAEIIICTACNGAGKVVGSVYVHHDEDQTTEECNRCGGSGRMIRKTAVEFQKFTP